MAGRAIIGKVGCLVIGTLGAVKIRLVAGNTISWCLREIPAGMTTGAIRNVMPLG